MDEHDTDTHDLDAHDLEDNAYIPLGRFTRANRADLYCSILQGHGIDTMLQNDSYTSLEPITGGITVLVPAADLERAWAIIEGHPDTDETDWDVQDEVEEELPPAEEDPNQMVLPVMPGTCPNCGSNAIHELQTPAYLRIAGTILLLGLPLLFGSAGSSQRRWTCTDCDWDGNI
jgi:hypothetical protein